jgi:hypothetical protein
VSTFWLGITQNFNTPTLYGSGIIGLERYANGNNAHNLKSFTISGIMSVNSLSGLFLCLSPVNWGLNETLNFNIQSGYWVYLGPTPT